MTPLRTTMIAVALAATLVASAVPAGAQAGERSVPVTVPSLRTDWQERMLARVNAVRATVALARCGCVPH